MRLKFFSGSILLLIGFILYQISFTFSLQNEKIVRETLVIMIATLPIGSEILYNSLLTQLLGGMLVFTGLLICANSLGGPQD